MAASRRACPALALVVALLAGCAEVAPPTAPHAAPDAAVMNQQQKGGKALKWVHRAPHTPPFKNHTVSLTARTGSAAEVTLEFADGSPFARLSLHPESMRGAVLDGQPVPDGQEITIVLRRVDASRYLVELQPAGLVFNPDAPAELVFYYANAIIAQAPAQVWKQEHRGQQWLATEHHDDRPLRQMKARVRDFTVYAMAYN